MMPLSASRLSCLMFVLLSAALQAHESPVERIDRMLRVWAWDGRLHLRYEVSYNERSALLELHAMDTNADGTIQEQERHTYFAAKAERMAEHFEIHVGDATRKPISTGEVMLRRNWRQVYDLSVPLTTLASGENVLRVAVRGMHIQPGEFRWTIGSGQAGAAPRAANGNPVGRLKPAESAKDSAGRPSGDIELSFILEVPPAPTKAGPDTGPERSQTE